MHSPEVEILQQRFMFHSSFILSPPSALTPLAARRPPERRPIICDKLVISTGNHSAPLEATVTQVDTPISTHHNSISFHQQVGSCHSSSGSVRQI